MALRLGAARPSEGARSLTTPSRYLLRPAWGEGRRGRCYAWAKSGKAMARAVEARARAVRGGWPPKEEAGDDLCWILRRCEMRVLA